MYMVLGKMSKSIIVASLGIGLWMSPSSEASAKVVDDDYNYDSMKEKTVQSAINLAKSISLNELKVYNIANPSKMGYQSIGQVSNSQTSAKATGFVAGDNYFITTANALKDNNGDFIDANKVQLITEKNAFFTKKVMNGQKIVDVPNTNLAVVHTKENVKGKIKPLSFAPEKNINNLKTNDNLTSVGYDNMRGTNNEVWAMVGKFIQSSTSEQEMINKSVLPKGRSENIV